MVKEFKTNQFLISQLEKKAGIRFSPKIITLFRSIGYQRLKNVIIYMRNNNIFISNNSIEAIYKNEKHLRHMLMPIIESIELTLKNHTLHEITRITIMGKIFDGDFKPIFIKERQKN